MEEDSNHRLYIYMQPLIVKILVKTLDNLDNTVIRKSRILHTRGRLGGAMMQGKLSVPGRPTNLDRSRARSYCACSRCGRVLFRHFSLHNFFSIFFLHLPGRRPDID